MAIQYRIGDLAKGIEFEQKNPEFAKLRREVSEKYVGKMTDMQYHSFVGMLRRVTDDDREFIEYATGELREMTHRTRGKVTSPDIRIMMCYEVMWSAAHRWVQKMFGKEESGIKT